METDGGLWRDILDFLALDFNLARLFAALGRTLRCVNGKFNTFCLISM
jgi:hypothetical protein